MPQWYEPHIRAWAAKATPQTTLWFWNSEIGWAAVHPILEQYGFRYVNANIWNKGKAHIAGNVNTQKIRRFPVVTEICVQYSFEAKVGGLPLKEWMLTEWKRTGLPVRKTNEACGIADAATRKYFDQGHLWYPPPPEKFQMLADYARLKFFLRIQYLHSVELNHVSEQRGQLGDNLGQVNCGLHRDWFRDR